MDVDSHNELLTAVRLLVSEDRCEGRFVFGRQISKASKKSVKDVQLGSGGENAKTHLQTLLNRAGHQAPTYKTSQLKSNKFRSTVMFNGLDFMGQPCGSKKEAEKDAAAEALKWFTGGDSQSSERAVDYMSSILKKKKKPIPASSRWK